MKNISCYYKLPYVNVLHEVRSHFNTSSVSASKHQTGSCTTLMRRTFCNEMINSECYLEILQTSLETLPPDELPKTRFQQGHAAAHASRSSLACLYSGAADVERTDCGYREVQPLAHRISFYGGFWRSLLINWSRVEKLIAAQLNFPPFRAPEVPVEHIQPSSQCIFRIDFNKTQSTRLWIYFPAGVLSSAFPTKIL
jgi:hypothetical protein